MRKPPPGCKLSRTLARSPAHSSSRSSIDDFGALAGGKFENVTVGRVMRRLGNPNFAGHDMFLAYDEPGRISIALGGGPVIRSSIDVLRDLQTYINNHGAIPSAKLDVDVHVSVAFGYAAHQVDDFTCDGLIALARERLLSDQGARDPFAVENVSIHEITPEAIIESAETPVTAVDMLALLREDLPVTMKATLRVSPRRLLHCQRRVRRRRRAVRENGLAAHHRPSTCRSGHLPRLCHAKPISPPPR